MSNIDPAASDPAQVEILSPDPIALNKSLPPSLSAYPDWPSFWAYAQTQPTNVLRDWWSKNSSNQNTNEGGGYQPFQPNPLSQQIPDRWIATAFFALKEERMEAEQGTVGSTESAVVPNTTATLMNPGSTDQLGIRENQGIIPGVTPGTGGVAPQVKPA